MISIIKKIAIFLFYKNVIKLGVPAAVFNLPNSVFQKVHFQKHFCQKHNTINIFAIQDPLKLYQKGLYGKLMV